MKKIFLSVLLIAVFTSCSTSTKNTEPNENKIAVAGTWKLLSGTLIENGDTSVTDYTGDTSFIKVINDSHFAFMSHDTKKGKDTTAFYASGGGSYDLKDSLYTEHLDYCSDRQWERNDFHFVIAISHDTLTIKGIEKVEDAGINRMNIEKYVRTKNE